MSGISSKVTWCPVGGIRDSQQQWSGCLLHLSSWLLGDSYGLLVCPSKDWALFRQTASVILFTMDDSKSLYSHQEIGNYLKYHVLYYSDSLSCCYFFFLIPFYLYFTRGPFRSLRDNALKMLIKRLRSVFGCILVWNSCSEHKIPSYL